MRTVLLSFLALLFLSASGGAQPPEKEPTIQVTATGSVEREPDRARILLSVETTGQTAQAATQENAVKMDRVFQSLAKIGLPDRVVRTASYHLAPKYETPEGRRHSPEPVGFTAQNTVEVTVDSVDLVGRVIDTAIAAGANRAANLTYGLRDPDAAYLSALRAAMAQAKAQAETLARAAGRTLGPVLRIATQSEVRPAAHAAPRMALAEAATPVRGGAVQVSATVTVHYRLAWGKDE